MADGPGRDDHDDANLEDLPELIAPEPASSSDDAFTRALGERYQLVARLGAGAFGEVYRARDTLLGRDVAVKRIRLEAFSEPSQQEELKQRFLREAQVAARLRHPNIVTTHDIVARDAASFIVMELVEGRTLESLLAERQRLPLAETVAILAQVASALDHAHAHDVVHRDVKPANVMVEPSGHVKVMDFGIARDGGGGNLTASGLIMGTPNYMPPEQARGEKADARSDLFSLGCVLYECLTGVKPFAADNLTGILIKILTAEAPPVPFEAFGLPEAVGTVLARAMAKEPSGRFASGGELIRALQAAGDRTRVASRPDLARARGLRPYLGRRSLALGASVVVLAAALALIVVARTPEPSDRETRPGSLVVEESRGLLDRLLGREPRLRITVPAGTALRLAIDEPLSSETSASGAAVGAETTGAIEIENVEAVPRGSRVRGRVIHASPARDAGGRGELTLVFESLEVDGGTAALRCLPLEMRAPSPGRSARRAELPRGLAEIGQAVEGLIGRIKGSGDQVEGGDADIVVVAHAKGREITLPAGAALTIELAEPLVLVRRRP